MTARRGLALAIPLLVAAALATGCGVPPPPPPAAPPSDLVVLVPDPEDGRLGSAVVRAQGGAVELTTAGDATRVAPGQAPSTPSTLAPDDIQRIFGDALGARP
ncbi:MAG: hypothetical protein AB7O32_20625, partial [Vicinamibacterales bacterium]